MPRQPRKPSSTGIFHVMMRGINHQEIFCDAEDYYHFINTLDRMRIQYDDDGNPCGTNCTYYAYCLMSNHFQIVVPLCANWNDSPVLDRESSIVFGAQASPNPILKQH